MTAARCRHEASLTANHRIATVSSKNQLAGKHSLRGLNGSIGIDMGHTCLGKKFNTSRLGLAPQPIVEQIAGDGTRSAQGWLEYLPMYQLPLAFNGKS